MEELCMLASFMELPRQSGSGVRSAMARIRRRTGAGSLIGPPTSRAERCTKALQMRGSPLPPSTLEQQGCHDGRYYEVDGPMPERDTGVQYARQAA